MIMNRQPKKIFLFFILSVLLFVFQTTISAQGVKRVVVIKVDGLPGYYVDRFVKERDPQTGKSMLPWFEEVFYKNGTRAENFYVRGMSLSAPSWSTLDTGQHLQIKGNVEFDRLTLHPYDYLNFIPYYVGYGMKKRVDMPGVEVLDQLKIPLLCDAFDYQSRYTSQQLFQRGNEWEVLAGGFINLFPKNINDLTDEWTLGFDFHALTVNQNERDITGKLIKNPEINYFDFYSPAFDHASHSINTTAVRFAVLKELDGTIGRIWTAIQKSSRADETALFVVSDHGFTSGEKNYSQGFNIVKILGSAEGGGHHAITKRRLMLDYSIKGVNPFVPLITTESKNSYYLKNQSKDYPTALVDFDGNERSAIHLRDRDLNVLQILMQQLQDETVSASTKTAAVNSIFDVLERRRDGWTKEIGDLTEELDALQSWINTQQEFVKAQPKKFTPEEIAKGLDKETRRISAQIEIAQHEENDYRAYLKTLSNLLAVSRETLSGGKFKIEDYIAKGAMGRNSSVYDLQNYVVGISENGLTANAANRIDFEKSFRRVNYFDLIKSQKVINNVQPEVGNQPIDFIVKRISLDAFADKLPGELQPNEDVIWLYGGTEKQALILVRGDADGNESFRYLPVANLRQAADGKVTFETKNQDANFPLKIFEDKNLGVSEDEKNSWLNSWHTEAEWINATYKTLYSDAIIDLYEQMEVHPLTGFENKVQNLSSDDVLIHRLRQRQRILTETDMLLVANNHWNFDIRGFNPGGNHGSLFQDSTHATLMAAGGAKTGIPRALTIKEPYDTLSFVPTVLALMRKINRDNEPESDLYQRGFRKFPGKVIREMMNAE